MPNCESCKRSLGIAKERAANAHLNTLITQEIWADPTYKGLIEAAETLSAAATRAYDARNRYFAYMYKALKAEALKVK